MSIAKDSGSETHLCFLRNEPRSKVELIFVKDGWLVKPKDEIQETEAVKDDCFIIRRWGLKIDGTAIITEIRLRASEFKSLANLSAAAAREVSK